MISSPYSPPSLSFSIPKPVSQTPPPPPPGADEMRGRRWDKRKSYDVEQAQSRQRVSDQIKNLTFLDWILIGGWGEGGDSNRSEQGLCRWFCLIYIGSTPSVSVWDFLSVFLEALLYKASCNCICLASFSQCPCCPRCILWSVHNSVHAVRRVCWKLRKFRSVLFCPHC
jgi:hypothetical protein